MSLKTVAYLILICFHQKSFTYLFINYQIILLMFPVVNDFFFCLDIRISFLSLWIGFNYQVCLQNIFKKCTNYSPLLVLFSDMKQPDKLGVRFRNHSVLFIIPLFYVLSWSYAFFIDIITVSEIKIYSVSFIG